MVQMALFAPDLERDGYRRPCHRRRTFPMIEAMNGCDCLRIRDEEGEEGLGTLCRSPKALQKLVLHIGARRTDPGPLVHNHFSDAGPT